ncbi:glycosyltransferase [Candidatus Woesearchaeota archaeon]|nr:glycosyltransferase [Candidatus Woesearchaeota archaeon]
MTKHKVAVFLEMAGTDRQGNLSGPYAGGKSFIEAVSGYSGHEVTFFSTKVTDPSISELVDKRNYFSMSEEELKRLIDEFDVVHVLNGKPTALKIGKVTDRAILGPNVVFGIPFIDIEKVDPTIRKEKAGYIQQENDVAAMNWGNLLTPNQSLETLNEARFNGRHGPTIAFPYGIDTDMFKPGKFERDEVVWVGGGPNRRNSKGADLVERVQGMLPGLNWVFLGKDELYKYGSQIPHLQKAKVFVATTRHETQGLAIFEAMACGAPVVIANYEYDGHDGRGKATHTPHYHRDGETSVVTTRDPKDIATAISSLITDEQRRRKLGENARDYVVKYFSLPGMAQQYDGIIERSVIETEEGISLPVRAKERRDSGKYFESMQDYDLLLKSDPHNHHHRYFAATVLETLGRLPEALEQYQLAGKGSSAVAGAERVAKRIK